MKAKKKKNRNRNKKMNKKKKKKKPVEKLLEASQNRPEGNIAHIIWAAQLPKEGARRVRMYKDPTPEAWNRICGQRACERINRISYQAFKMQPRMTAQALLRHLDATGTK